MTHRERDTVLLCSSLNFTSPRIVSQCTGEVSWTNMKKKSPWFAFDYMYAPVNNSIGSSNGLLYFTTKPIHWPMLTNWQSKFSRFFHQNTQKDVSRIKLQISSLNTAHDDTRTRRIVLFCCRAYSQICQEFRKIFVSCQCPHHLESEGTRH